MIKQRNIWIIGGVLVAIPIILFLLKFLTSNVALSDNIDDWGNFGDYFSGTVGIITAIINVVLFTIITIEISKINDINNEKNLNFERKKIVTDLRYQSIKCFEQEVSRLTDTIGNLVHNNQNNLVLWEVLKAENYFNRFLQTYHDIFPDMNGALLQHDLTQLNAYFAQNQNNTPLLTQTIDDFNTHNIAFITALRGYMINQINT